MRKIEIVEIVGAFVVCFLIGGGLIVPFFGRKVEEEIPEAPITVYASPDPDNTKYDFQNHGADGENAWEGYQGGVGHAPELTPGQVPSGAVAEATSAEYTAIEGDDASFWDFTGQETYEMHIFKFNIQEDKNEFDNIHIKWIGYGSDNPIYFYIWNESSSSWELLDSSGGGGSEVTYENIVTVNPENYIHENTSLGENQLWLAVTHEIPGGSCPVLYVWNGEEYISYAEASSAGGIGFPTPDGFYDSNPKSYEVLPEGVVTAENGLYHFVLGEDLDEITYQDLARLSKVYHPVGTQLVSGTVTHPLGPCTNNKIYSVRDLQSPRMAVYENGDNILSIISEYDGWFTPGGVKGEYDRIILDLGDLSQASQITLVMKMYTEWLNVWEMQSSYAEVIDENGNWVRVNERVDSLPETVEHPTDRLLAIDITDWFLTDNYWLRFNDWHRKHYDFIAIDTSPDWTFSRELNLSDAELYRKGKSERHHSPIGDWWEFDKTFEISAKYSGYFTRYGDVKSLLENSDDMYVIMWTGDAIKVEFEARFNFLDLLVAFGLLERTFVLESDAWYKEEWTKVLFGENVCRVEPLPFHGMSYYPYPENENFPWDEEHLEWWEEYQTRYVEAETTHQTIYSDYVMINIYYSAAPTYAWGVIEEWSGTINAGAVWQSMETWSGTVNTTVQWGDIEIWWSCSIEAPAEMAGKPVLYLPVNNSRGNDNTPYFEWTIGENATSQRLVIDNDQDFLSPAVDVTISIAENSHTIPLYDNFGCETKGTPNDSEPDTQFTSYYTCDYSGQAQSITAYLSSHQGTDNEPLVQYAIYDNSASGGNPGSHIGDTENWHMLTPTDGWVTLNIDNKGEIPTAGTYWLTIYANGPGGPFGWCYYYTIPSGDHGQGAMLTYSFPSSFGTYYPLTAATMSIYCTYASSLENDNYYWKVIAKNAFGENSSDVWEFEVGPPKWEVIESWTGTINTQVSWSAIETWGGTVEALAQWTIIETWAGTVETTVEWQGIEVWTGTINTIVEWSEVEQWTGTITAEAVWGVIEQWSGTVNATAQWNVIKEWVTEKTGVVIDDNIRRWSDARLPSQHKAFYVANRYWIFYNNYDVHKSHYRTSTDGINWSENTEIGSTEYGADLDVCLDDEDNFHLVRDEYPQGETIYYRKGTPLENGDISWLAGWQTITGSDIWADPIISVDENGYPWVGYGADASGFDYYDPEVTKSDNKDGTWQTSSGFPYELRDFGSSGQAPPPAFLSIPVPLTNGQICVVYGYHSSFVANKENEKLYCKIWNGSSWSGEENISENLLSGEYFSKFSASTMGNDIYVTFVDNTEQLYFRKRTWGVGWGSVETVESGLAKSDGVSTAMLAEEEENIIWVFWGDGTNHIYYRKRINGAWGDKVDWINETTDKFYDGRGRTVCSAPEVYGNKVLVYYVTEAEGSGPPYKLKFAYIDLVVLRISAPANWSIIESWTGSISVEAEWSEVEVWSGGINTIVSWQQIEQWSGTINAEANWQSIESWTGTLNTAPANVPPVIQNVYITDMGNNPVSTLDPDAQYKFWVEVQDNDTIADVDSVELCFYENILSWDNADNTRNHYSLRWTRGEGFSEVGPGDVLSILEWEHEEEETWEQIAQGYPVGDPDNDGKNELMFENYRGFEIWEWNGSTYVYDHGITEGNDRFSGYVSGNTDDDSEEELVLANFHSENVSVYDWNGSSFTRTFTRDIIDGAGRVPYDVNIGECDNNETPWSEIIVSCGYTYDNVIEVLTYDNVAVTYTLKGGFDTSLTGLKHAHMAEAGDVDNDTENEIVFVCFSSAGNYFYIIEWNGSSYENIFSVNLSPDNDSYGVALGDIDGDGVSEILISNAAYLWVYEWNGSTFVEKCLINFAGESAWTGYGIAEAVDVGDFDDDDELETLVVTDNAIHIMRWDVDNLAEESYSPIEVETIGGAFAGTTMAQFGDANNDGSNEIVIGKIRDTAILWVYYRGYDHLLTDNCSAGSDSETVENFVFCVKLSKMASPNNQWTAWAKVVDNSDDQDIGIFPNLFYVNQFKEFSMDDAAISFAGNPGQTVGAVQNPTVVTITTNDTVKIEISLENAEWTGGYIDENDTSADNDGSAPYVLDTLSTSWQILYDTIPWGADVQRNVYWFIYVPPGTPPGSYTNTLKVKVAYVT